MPTIQQLVRKPRVPRKRRSKSPALQSVRKDAEFACK